MLSAKARGIEDRLTSGSASWLRVGCAGALRRRERCGAGNRDREREYRREHRSCHDGFPLIIQNEKGAYRPGVLST